MSKLPSNAGYAEEADDLFIRYEARDPADIHAPWADFFPDPPADILDIGAGTGRDAAWFAALGHRVVAAEPTDVLRTRAAQLHPDPNITWVDDALPGLPRLRARKQTFDLVLLHAVWMHLDAAERKLGMASLAGLLKSGGRLAMSLRHGPIPKGRRMFDVSGKETITLAHEHGLINRMEDRSASIAAENRAIGVEWTKLVFKKT
ncbi:MAG: class I SAM-dependent methyltransferase [Pseudomonadota bacterium]